MIGLIILGILATFTLIIVGWIIGVYNMLVIAFQEVRNQLSNIKTEYQRRADLFINLMESTKSYKKHEKNTLVELTQARSGNFGKTPKEEIKKMKGLENVFARLLAIQENYPNLKADTIHTKLMDEIRITEDRINIARTDYNELVKDFNVLIKTFPNFIIANMLKYQSEPFFENDEASNKTVIMKLN